MEVWDYRNWCQSGLVVEDCLSMVCWRMSYLNSGNFFLDIADWRREGCYGCIGKGHG
jgi:hypothetical protein